MRNIKTLKLVQSALLAALCLLLTRVVTIPAPTGYVNLGDCAVLLSAWMLGPIWGGMAAGIGTMLADVLSGYASYAPATFVIKFAMAVIAALIFRTLEQRQRLSAHIVGAVSAEVLMIAGYYIFESACLGVGAAAAASVPANMVQGVAGAVSGVLGIGALSKFHFVSQFR